MLYRNMIEYSDKSENGVGSFNVPRSTPFFNSKVLCWSWIHTPFSAFLECMCVPTFIKRGSTGCYCQCRNMCITDIKHLVECLAFTNVSGQKLDIRVISHGYIYLKIIIIVMLCIFLWKFIRSLWIL